MKEDAGEGGRRGGRERAEGGGARNGHERRRRKGVGVTLAGRTSAHQGKLLYNKEGHCTTHKATEHNLFIINIRTWEFHHVEIPPPKGGP